MKTLTFLTVLFTLLTSITFAENVTFSYSGRVRVQGTPYDGTGHFKLAIVSNNGNTTYWSNDSSSSDGAEPTTSIPITVTDGIFSINVGDVALGMDPINRTVFNQPNKIKLRIWFSDGVLGFEHLLPDANLNNVDLLGMETGEDDFTIYVDGMSGSDDNDGLTTETAKSTINGAIDIVPPRLSANVTIKIFPGIYQEEVLIYGQSTRPGTSLTILGDEEWLPSDVGDPNVRITQAADLMSPSQGGTDAVIVTNSSTVRLVGLQIDYAARSGIFCDQSSVDIERCRLSNNRFGLFTSQSNFNIRDCLAEENSGVEGSGFRFSSQSFANIRGTRALNNSHYGIYAQNASYLSFQESGEFSDNGGSGILCVQGSRVYFAPSYSGVIENNGGPGIQLSYYGYSIDHTQNSFNGNGGADVQSSNGGAAF